jgi:hypothetical protein
MSCCEDEAEIDQEIADTKALIAAYRTALLAMADGRYSYSFNTGQTTQTVTRANIGEVRRTLDWLNTDLARLRALKCGPGVHVIPGF